MAGIYGRYPNTYREKMGRLSSIGDITEDDLADGSRPISGNLEPVETQMPIVEPNLTGTEEPAAKPSWLSKAWGGIKDTFSAGVDAPRDKEGNLTEAPQVKEGMGHKILRYALPAMMSAGAGQGIAPGLFAGMIASGKARGDHQKNLLKFNEDKIKKQAAADELTASNAYRQAMVNKPSAGSASLGALGDRRKYASIMSKGKDATREEKKWALGYERANLTSKFDTPAEL